MFSKNFSSQVIIKNVFVKKIAQIKFTSKFGLFLTALPKRPRRRQRKDDESDEDDDADYPENEDALNHSEGDENNENPAAADYPKDDVVDETDESSFSQYSLTTDSKFSAIYHCVASM